MSSLITRLNSAGSLVLYHDYRSGSLRDWSQYGHDGAVTGAGPIWSGDGILCGNNHGIKASATSALDACTDMSFVFLGDFQTNTTIEYLAAKYGASQTWRVYIDGSNVKVTDSIGANRTIAGDVIGKRSIGVRMVAGQNAALFFDGVYEAESSSTVSTMSTATNGDIYLGTYFSTPEYDLHSSLHAVLMVSGNLTDSQFAELHAEFYA